MGGDYSPLVWRSSMGLAPKWNPQASGLAQLSGLAPKYSRLRLYFGA